MNNNKLINEKLVCAFRWSVLPSIIKMHGPKNKIPNVAQTIGNVDGFDPRSGISGPTWRRASTCPNLHE